MTDLCDLTAVEQLGMLERSDCSAVELLDAHLARIDAVNPSVNAIVALDPDVARPRAEAVDRARAAGDDVGPLAGLVTAHKDLVDTADFVTTRGSVLFEGFRPDRDGLVAQRMRAAGAVAVGKTNVPEFGTGSHTFNEVYGTTVNPFDTGRSAGGSSGGAAAALVTGMVSTADGSDMGGSLRNPAAWNGVVGFRPTPGRVPWVEPGLGWAGLGTEGPMGRTVADTALLFSVLGRPDPRDPLSHGDDPPVAPVAIGDTPLRVAYSPTLGGLPVEPAVLGVVSAFVERLGDLGWIVEEAEPDMAGTDECFDTIRAQLKSIGQSALPPEDRAKLKATNREELASGEAVTAADLSAAWVRKTELWRRGLEFFDSFDLLVAPVTQLSPFPAEWEYPTEVAGQPMTRYLDWMRSCCRITAFGFPALSLPCGFDDDGLPVGLQVIARQHRDVWLLGAAAHIERELPIGPRRPSVLGG